MKDRIIHPTPGIFVTGVENYQISGNTSICYDSACFSAASYCATPLSTEDHELDVIQRMSQAWRRLQIATRDVR
jgi:hypothetical protein